MLLHDCLRVCYYRDKQMINKFTLVGRAGIIMGWVREGVGIRVGMKVGSSRGSGGAVPGQWRVGSGLCAEKLNTAGTAGAPGIG